MITESPFNANLAILEPGEKNYQAAFEGIENFQFDESRSYGFNISESGDMAIDGYFVEKTPVKTETFDVATQQVVDREIEQTLLIPFQLDFDIGLLSIFSDQSDTSKLISRIGEASGFSFPITETQLPIGRLYANLQDREWSIDVSSIRIQNFEAEGGLSGTYTIKDVGDIRIRELIDSHSSDITILRANIKTPSQEATFGFFQSGTVRLYSSLESEEPLWSEVKEITREAYNG
ncbi:hypothetical protein [Natrinema salifodinae]|uniref:hypothetical protein n=1 Tax=Natrinema salifodinae TaxID=1202768 RepID=UPI001F4D1D6D|nr:hypothetical protein [Natrinema salifodinae]